MHKSKKYGPSFLHLNLSGKAVLYVELVHNSDYEIPCF